MDTNTNMWLKLKSYVQTAIWVALVAVIAYWIGSKVGANRYNPAVQLSTNRLHARAVGEFQSRAEEIDNTTDLAEAARKLAEAKIELAHNRNLVDDYRRPCPATDGWRNGVQKIVLTGCDAGKGIWILPPDGNEFNEYKLSATLYKISDGDKLVQVAVRPELVVRKPNDGFSFVKETSPTGSVSPVDYQVRGKLKFVTIGGDADVLVLELIK
ncbi:MAG: hypothetical protein HY918_04285 [Candidatus Doudnabacteria bacterium]|nr:hypothetical protein [Candidatus Doudnabacteria bacterium]